MTRLMEYKGYVVEVEEDGDFTASDVIERKGDFTQHVIGGEYVVTAKTLEALKAEVDKISKAKLTQPCFILLQHYDKPSRLVKGTVTSIKSNDAYGIKIRVTFKQGNSTRREELAPDDIYKVTPENEKTIAKVIQTEKDIASLEKLKESFEKKLKSFKKEDFIQ